METLIDQGTAQAPVSALVAAALALSRAARYDEAFGVVDDAEPDTVAGRVALAVAAAQIALGRDHDTGGHTATERIARAEQLVDRPGDRWTVTYLQMRDRYHQALHHADGSLWLGPVGRDPAEMAALRELARQARDAAPDQVARGWADMCLGWIADNIYGERDAAPPHYAAGLRAGEAGNDELLVREALRHLGDHDHDRGDHAAARARWQRAAEVGAHAGAVRGTLAQQLLLAVLSRDAGDEAGARLLATEIARWAGAIGAVALRAQTTAFLAGIDPTAPTPRTA